MDFLDEVEARVLPGDGALDSCLAHLGTIACIEALSVSAQDSIRDAHNQYIRAGARVIRTNSFGASALRLARHGLEKKVNEINWSAAQLARECSRGKGVYVAGSVGPLGIIEGEAGIDRRALFQEQVGALLDGGVQLIFFERFTDVVELEIALDVKHSLHHCPVICSLLLHEDGNLGNGLSPDAAWRQLRESGADLVGLNGPVAGPGSYAQMLDDAPFALFPDGAGDFQPAIESMVKTGARVIGGGAGTGPGDIVALVRALQSTNAQQGHGD